jgi:glycerol uptake facilitator-like aquaporin
MSLVEFSQIWIHVVGNFAGAAAATLAFKVMNPSEN